MASERAERLAAARARLVYLANQSAHCDGACHQAITEFVYSADALVAELEAVEEDATTALRGVRGTSRAAGRDDVEVAFTDEGWEAAKRVLAALARGGTPATRETSG